MVGTWVRTLGAALLTAAVAGAGQLGIAYGLGVLRWDQRFDAGRDNVWSAHLTWAAWIASVAVVIGALAGVRALRRNHIREGLGGWVAVSLAALVGGAVVVPLTTLRAAASVVPIASVDPELNVGLAAGIGAAVGLFAALAALAARPVAASIIVTVCWVWLAAVVSAGSNVGRATADIRVGVVDVDDLGFGLRQLLVLPVLVGVALLTGAAIAGYARWLGETSASLAVCGLAGPALVAAAYIIAGPGISGEHQDQRLPWLASLIAVGAGLAGSVVVTMAGRRRPESGVTEPVQRPAERPVAPAAEPVPPPPPRVTAPRSRREDDYAGWLSAMRDDTADAEELRSGERRRGRDARAEPDDPTEPLSLGRPYVRHAD